MQTLRDDYLNAYHSLKLTRDAEGVLVAQFQSNGGRSPSPRRIIPRSSMLSTGSRRIAQTRL